MTPERLEDIRKAAGIKGTWPTLALLREVLTYVDQLREALKHACDLLLSPSEDFDEADGEWAWNTRAAILSSPSKPLTHEQAATLRAEGAELRREIERHTEPMKRGPFEPP